jgi:hypothetical protein
VYDLRLVHQLCDRITTETEPRRIKAICDVLRSVMRVNDAELALRLKLLQRRYERIALQTIRKVEKLPDLPGMDLAAVRPSRTNT